MEHIGKKSMAHRKFKIGSRRLKTEGAENFHATEARTSTEEIHRDQGDERDHQNGTADGMSPAEAQWRRVLICMQRSIDKSGTTKSTKQHEHWGWGES
jgi:hypothetical protein